MKLIFITLCFIIGTIMVVFNEKLIELFNEDKYIDHKQNKYSKIIGGIGLIILGIWGLFEYLFN